jgi:aminoglycoside phosphotransferase (APT) family kinase protein
MQSIPDGREVVASWDEADALEQPPLLVLDRLTEFLDARDLGDGPLSWERIGEGHSNITYRIRRGPLVMVLRRGPRPPLPRSTHDMVREARIQQLLRPQGIPVPEILAVCEDDSILGVPCYVMEWLDGEVITDHVPPSLDTPSQRRATSLALVESLVDLHMVDVSIGELKSFGRPEGFLERQLGRFAALWDTTASRTVPEVQILADWLSANLPASQAASVVHGDYRLGNVMFRRDAPTRPLAVLDWEMATLGDPLTDLGYMTATYTDPNSCPNPLQLSSVTSLPGFLRAEELAELYATRTSLDLTPLPWYRALALWKGAIVCEAIYSRWLRGERPEDFRFGPSLERGVPILLAAAQAHTRYP